MKRILSVLILAIFSCAFNQALLQAQTFQGYYHMLDSSELYAPLVPNKAFTTTPPPSGTIRAIAEWEPAQAVIVSYPGNFGIPYSLIASMSQHTPVITLVESSGQQSTVTASYNSNGVNTANCSFVVTPLDSYWSRDYSPWFIMINNSEVAIVDFPYNRPTRPNDDNVPVVLAPLLGMDLYGMNIYHTGGNYMCDGMGVTATTNLVLDENSYTEAQIDTLMKQYMGAVNNYITTDPLGEYIKHIDCWGKFIDVDKIVIGQVSTGNAQYSQYEAMATYWANQVSSYGNHYQVYRVYEPNGEPYTNGLILNKTVYIPTMGGTHASNDAAALAVYQNAMPGYNVIGVTYSGWQSTDALHCRTHEVADKNMLYVQHHPLLGPQTFQSQYTINANIYALSGSAIIADSVRVKYRVNNGAWQTLQMTHPSGNSWTAAIPQQATGDTISYYICAADQSPKSVTHPLIGAPDPHKFYITGTTGSSEWASEPALIFPNPAVDEIFVQVRDENTEVVELSLMNSLGQEVMHQTVQHPATVLVQMDIRKLPAGTYFLRTSSHGNSDIRKILIMH